LVADNLNVFAKIEEYLHVPKETQLDYWVYCINMILPDSVPCQKLEEKGSDNPQWLYLAWILTWHL
jgi:hypothetical protein